MHTQIVAITQPWVRTEDNTRFLDAEEFIVFCARVSNPSNQLNLETASNLLKYCIKHEHWSIFEQCSMTAEIQTSRDISAQIIRHKSFSFQEFSQRYSNVAGLESFVLRKQADKNRQSSSEVLDLPDEFVQKIKDHLLQSVDLYNEVITKGGARECARKILPLCTQTTLYMTGSVRSWIHYLSLRTKQDTQLEHREIAESIKNSFIRIFPNISSALDWTEVEKVQPEPPPAPEKEETKNVSRKNTFQPFHPEDETKIKLENDSYVL
jgi:thymidylate synthase (FAD)